ncbi:hypothetical protein O6R08_06010 [Cutibacterium equinum]|uniref:Uncharacterized protein n=1 Tax=Cutibacterium equinum TaxID=3016342 RepID=A0ABY7QVM0_9ACTN|nr:hypothetical protein [Cutibacterium equinum]WCC79118.1 hypothetical protein O6R08_06010 [Cutibacterium equinum]
MRELETEWLGNDGIARITRTSPLRGQADRAVAAGRATRVLPGIVVPTDRADDMSVKIRALHIWDPQVVLVGRVALGLQGITPLDTDSSGLDAIDEVEAFSPTRRLKRDGLVVHRWHVPDHYILDDPVALAVPEMSVLLLAIRGEWEWVCAALEQGLVTPWSCRMARGSMSWRSRQHDIDAALDNICGNAGSASELELARRLRDRPHSGWTTTRPQRTAAAA